jgi:hypothetical protein
MVAVPEEQHRSYLQRAEVRLSTMHRIASAFLGGAGLTILFPFLFRDTFENLFGMPIQEAMNFLNGRSPGVDPQDLLYLGAVVAGSTSSTQLLYVSPLVAIFWLFQDLVGFYFSGNAPSFDDGYRRQAGAPTSFSRWVGSTRISFLMLSRRRLAFRAVRRHR